MVDVRDLVAFDLKLQEERRGGTYNAANDGSPFALRGMRTASGIPDGPILRRDPQPSTPDARRWPFRLSGPEFWGVLAAVFSA